MAACWSPKTATARSTGSAIKASETCRFDSGIERGRSPDTAAILARVASQASRQADMCYVPFLGAEVHALRGQQPASCRNLPGLPQGQRGEYRATAPDAAGAFQSPEAPGAWEYRSRNSRGD